ncbi:MAG: hypothetical protein WCT27_02510 [Patescibacteria group bacterium]|jgi:hypothetical protein
MAKPKVLCVAIDGNRCSICKYLIPDGDTVCSGAGHEIGQSYDEIEFVAVAGAVTQAGDTNGHERLVHCIPVEGSLCSICMQPFQGGDTCPNGHAIGGRYEKKR